MATDLALYLSLTAEFGGTRFGPFEGAEVRLGSDPDQNDITLPEQLGVISSHVKILRQSEQNIILAPTDRSAAVFVWQGQAVRPKQVTTPIAVRAGDSFALVTPQGPRFVVEIAELPPEIQEQRDKQRLLGGGRRRLSAKAMADEGKRQVWWKILTTGAGQMVQRAYTFVVSGAIFMPRNILMIVGVAGGYLFGGFHCISKGSIKKNFATQGDQLDSCKAQVAFADSMGATDSQEYTFTELARAITRVGPLGPALENDAPLLTAVKSKAKVVFANSTDYEWLTNTKSSKGKSGEFAQLRELLLEADGISGDTARLLAYTATTPDRSRQNWAMVTDSNGDDVCARGPSAITFRQAVNLGLKPQLDALLTKGIADFQDEGGRARRLEALSATAQAANYRPFLDQLQEGEGALAENLSSKIDPIRQGREACLVVEGSDGRQSAKSVARAMVRHLGDDGAFLPDSDVNFGVTARLAKFYAADMDLVDFTQGSKSGLDLTQAAPGIVMEGEGPRGAWVIEQTASTIARAMVLPCIAVLNNSENSNLGSTFGDELPGPVNCLVLDWQLRHGE